MLTCCHTYSFVLCSLHMICETYSWILIHVAFEDKICFRRILGISHKEHNTNEYVWKRVISLAQRQELLLSTAKRRKLSWFGHVCRHDTLPKIIIRGKVDGYGCRTGRPRKSWNDNNKEWTGQSMSSLLRIGDDKSCWAVITADRGICRSTLNDAWASRELVS